MVAPAGTKQFPWLLFLVPDTRCEVSTGRNRARYYRPQPNEAVAVEQFPWQELASSFPESPFASTCSNFGVLNFPKEFNQKCAKINEAALNCRRVVYLLSRRWAAARPSRARRSCACGGC